MQGRVSRRLAGRTTVVAVLTATASLLVAASASASFHLMKISEVYPGSAPTHDDAFVELQMYADGQTFVSGKQLSYYESGGANTPVYSFTGNVSNGQSQRTILVGDTAVAGADFPDPNLSDFVKGPGGAVCFGEPSAAPVDCVAWGNFTNTSSLPVGTPASAIPNGQSLTRSISPNCPTLLEAADDTDNSATDFSLTTPTPRSNSVTPTEVPCDTDPPETTITKSPPGKTDETTVRYKFRSDEAGSTFQCKLDRDPYKKCSSPKKLKKLDEGKHKFAVRAIDSAGNIDQTPARDKFKVLG